MKQPHEWDAGTYHHVSTPQQSWGLRVLDRLQLAGGERVLDAGCGTGRVTLALAERAAFIDALCDEEAVANPPFMLDYVRLNIEARLAS